NAWDMAGSDQTTNVLTMPAASVRWNRVGFAEHAAAGADLSVRPPLPHSFRHADPPEDRVVLDHPVLVTLAPHPVGLFGTDGGVEVVVHPLRFLLPLGELRLVVLHLGDDILGLLGLRILVLEYAVESLILGCAYGRFLR